MLLTLHLLLQNFREALIEHFNMPFAYKSRLVHFTDALAQVVLPLNLNGWDILPDSLPCSVSFTCVINVVGIVAALYLRHLTCT